MLLSWRERLLLTAALTATAPLAAQQGRELGVQAIGTASDPALAVIGLYGGVRTSNRTRVSLSAGVGPSSDQLAYRGEVLGHFLLSPAKRSGAGFYFAGGVAAVGGPVERGYLVLTIGVEQHPGAGAGWVAEAGIGGGARVLLGYRWRWLPRAFLP